MAVTIPVTFTLTVWMLIYSNGALYQQKEEIVYQKEATCKAEASQVINRLKLDSHREIIIIDARCEKDEDEEATKNENGDG